MGVIDLTKTLKPLYLMNAWRGILVLGLSLFLIEYMVWAVSMFAKYYWLMCLSKSIFRKKLFFLK